MTDHPITPSPELAAKWVAEIYDHPAVPLHSITLELVERAAQYGADQELEACCKLLEVSDNNARDFLRSARRPPASLKQQALALIDKIQGSRECWLVDELDVVRKALEQIDG